MILNRNNNCSVVPHPDKVLSHNQWATNANLCSRKRTRVLLQNRRRKNNMRNIKKASNKTSELESTMKAFLQNSSLYILNRIGNSKTTVRKFFWIVILFMGGVGCLLQVGLFLESYYDYPVVVNLDSMKSDIQLFPAVTICNVNCVCRVFEQCVNFKLSYDECSEINRGNNINVSFSKNSTSEECEYDMDPQVNESNKQWLYSLLSLDYNSRLLYGHSPKNFIAFCSYMGEKCLPLHFKHSLSQSYGNCYTFESAKYNVISKHAGPIHGLILELNLEVDKYRKCTGAAGARVEIHDPHLPHRIDLKGIFVVPGYETNIAVKKSILSRLPSPYKDNCKYYERGQSQLTCRDHCVDSITVSSCSCTTTINQHSSIRQCNLTDSRTRYCVSKASQSDICDCPLSCEEAVYDIQASSAVWPSRNHYENHRNLYLTSLLTPESMTYEDFRETKLKLRIYYDTLDYTVYKQNPLYQTSEIFSQVGAQMGLWLGLSLVIIVECLESIMIMCRKKMVNFNSTRDQCI